MLSDLDRPQQPLLDLIGVAASAIIDLSFDRRKGRNVVARLELDGKTAGVAILNHPSSFRYPTYWHVRTYGLFAANPFGLHNFIGKEHDGSHAMEKGDSFTLRYRVIFHRGDVKAARIQEAFNEYAAWKPKK